MIVGVSQISQMYKNVVTLYVVLSLSLSQYQYNVNYIVISSRCKKQRGHLAQLVERSLRMRAVMGSIPIVSTVF